jgi:hypothetical protein
VCPCARVCPGSPRCLFTGCSPRCLFKKTGKKTPGGAGIPVCGDACVPGLGVDWRGLGVVWRARVGGWVGFEGVRFVRFVCLSCVCPGSPRCLFTGTCKGHLKFWLKRKGG